MKSRLMLALVALPSMVFAQGVTRTLPAAPEVLLFSATRAALASPGQGWGHYRLPSGRTFTVTAILPGVSTAGGGGAGTVVWTLTDGSNNCTATFTCSGGDAISDMASTGAKRAATAGTCTFPVGAGLTLSVTAAGCTSTQPAINTTLVVGYWN